MLLVVLLHAALLHVAALASLPSQQPEAPAEEPRGLRVRTERASPGYTLFAPLRSKSTYLVDLDGREVHRWTSELPPSAVYFLADGSLLRTERLEKNPVFEGGGICGRIERVGWDGELLWSYELATADQTQHHDARPMPNGNVLVIAWEFRYREDCIAAGRDPEQCGEKGLWPDAVLEVRPTSPEGGEVVWEWHAWDHLVQDFDAGADNAGSIADHPELLDLNYDHRGAAPESAEERKKREELEESMRALGYSGDDEDEDDEDDAAAAAAPAPRGFGRGSDWMHTNSVDYCPELDLVLLSSPNLSEIWIVDHSTTSEQAAGHSGGRYGKGGDLLWRWGNPRNYGAGTSDDRRLFFQHNAHWIPPGLPGAGHVLVFNNGQGRPGVEHSSIEELALPLEPGKRFAREGRAFGPAAPAWSYRASDPQSFYAPFISGCQRLANGNTLICEGPSGRVFEVTPEGETAWEYRNPYGGDFAEAGVDASALFRATRIAPDHPGLAGRTLALLEAR